MSGREKKASSQKITETNLNVGRATGDSNLLKFPETTNTAVRTDASLLQVAADICRTAERSGG